MRVYKHNPHPIDLSDYFYGRVQMIGGRDFDQEEMAEPQEAKNHEELPSGFLLNSVNRIRRSVSERLFSIELKDLKF